MADFKTGEIVQLKSGGPKMTVQSVNVDSIWCQWFAGSKLEKGLFPKDSVIKVTNSDKSNKKES